MENHLKIIQYNPCISNPNAANYKVDNIFSNRIVQNHAFHHSLMNIVMAVMIQYNKKKLRRILWQPVIINMNVPAPTRAAATANAANVSPITGAWAKFPAACSRNRVKPHMTGQLKRCTGIL